MRVAVFGGAGFIGSHVADALTERDHDVLLVDRRASPHRNARQQVLIGDVLDPDCVRDALRGCDVVYNFAGLADLDACATQPIETVRENVLGNALLLEAAASAGVQRFVFSSTVYVYSTAGGFYRASKQAAELYIEEFQRSRGLPFTILRYGTLYGRRADHRNSVYRFLEAAIRDRRIVYPGDGEEIREYIHVSDAARCSVDILTPEFENQHVVLTGHQQMRVSDLLQMIREMVGPPLDIVYAANPPLTSSHYRITPYSFQPKIARKLISSYYLDMGQGLLDCLGDVAERLESKEGAATDLQTNIAVGSRKNQGG